MPGEIFKSCPLILNFTKMAPVLARPFTKASTMVEQDLSASDLRALLWGHGQELQRLSPLTTAALNLYYKKGMYSLLSTDPSPLTSLFDHPALSQGMGSYMVGPFTRSNWPVAGSFVHPSSGTPIVPGGQGNWITAL